MDGGAKRDLQELMKQRTVLEGRLAEHAAPMVGWLLAWACGIPSLTRM